MNLTQFAYPPSPHHYIICHHLIPFVLGFPSALVANTPIPFPQNVNHLVHAVLVLDISPTLYLAVILTFRLGEKHNSHKHNPHSLLSNITICQTLQTTMDLTWLL